MSLLDTILANHDARTNPANIASRQDSLHAVNWLNGVTDPGEMIACGAYQQLRRQENETDDTYRARVVRQIEELPPHERDKIKSTLINAANARHAIDSTSGRIAAVYGNNRPAWHRLGTVYTGDVKTLDLEDNTSLNFGITKRPMYVWTPDGPVIDDDAFSLHRDDTGAKLTTTPVGSRYTVIQNRDAWRFLDKVVAGAGARYDAVGSIYGGRQMFVSVHMPAHAYKINGHSHIDPYILFFKRNDGTGCDVAFGTEVRAECANTSRLAIAGRGNKGVAIRHTGDIDAKIEDARKALGLTLKTFEAHKEEAQALASTPMPVGFTLYANAILDAALDITEAQVKQGPDLLAQAVARTKADADLDALRKSFQRKINNREGILEDILERWDSKTQDGIRGSLYGAYNAVSESADHGKLGGRFQGDQDTRNSRQLLSVIEGAADDRKQIAYNVAMSYLKA